MRVALGLIATILLTIGLNLPHGEWASMTMLVVIGGLQHHGNIGKKAAERAIGPLEILGNTRRDASDPQTMVQMQLALKAEYRPIRVLLIGMARALQTGVTQRLEKPVEGSPENALEAPVYSALDGYRLLTRQLAATLGEMRQRLGKSARYWRISPRHDRTQALSISRINRPFNTPDWTYRPDNEMVCARHSTVP